MNEQTLFAEALERADAGERAAFLDQACQGQPTLRKRIERLLAQHEHAGTFLEYPAAATIANFDEPISQRPGTVIGPYKLLEQIGEGGMGTVWMAQQTEPVKRLVALKLIKPGLDSKQVVARFEAERQALALMDHPNIARVLDAGTTGTENGVRSVFRPTQDAVLAEEPGPKNRSDTVFWGRPYFVMELVKGVPITKYCDEHKLTLRHRLELFIPVCQAIQHAHQKGIIHRDLKPSNVLVASYDEPLHSGGESRVTGVPKVIDFGVAKAAGPALTEETLVTGFGAIVGTLEYMSPEQAEVNQLDIDTRSDIYSLGVLLYELLTGSPPFTRRELAQAGVLEMLRVIREQEPSKPSTKLSTAEGLPTLAAKRGTEPAKLARLVRGELDWIVMKALEKDRNRRYETANSFAMDLQRYLADEHVLACPPSTAYRFQKFVRRNKRALAVMGLVMVFLVLLGSGIGWVIGDRAAREAALEQEAGQALQEAISFQKQQRWPEALEAVKRAEAVLIGEGRETLREQARAMRADLSLLLTLEEIRLEQAEVKDGHFNVEDADPKYKSAFQSYGLDIDDLEAGKAAAYIQSRGISLEITAALDVWAQVRRLLRPKEGGWRHLLAVAKAVDPDSFANQVRDAWGRQDDKQLERLAAEAIMRRCTPTTVILFATALHDRNADKVILPLMRQAQRQFPDDFWINHLLAMRLQEALEAASNGDVPAAQMDEIIGFYRVSLALRPTSPGVYVNLGRALRQKGLYDDSLAACQRALELKPDYAEAHDGRGTALVKLGKPEEAIAAYQEAIRLKPNLASAHRNLGLTLHQQGKPDEAIVEHREAMRLQPDNGDNHYNLGIVLSGLGKKDEAIAAYREAIRLKPDKAEAHTNLASILRNQGKLAESIALCHEAIRLKPDLWQAHSQLGLALVAQRKWAEAATVYRKAVELKPDSYENQNNLGTALGELGKLDEAITAFREAARLRPDSPETHTNLGSLLAQKGALDEAIVEVREAVRLKPDDAEIHNNLGATLDKKGELDQALAAYREALRLKPDLLDAHFNLGLHMSDRGQLDEALAAFREVVRLNPDWAVGYFRLGYVLKRQGRWDQAIGAYEKALRLDPNHASSLNNLAELLASSPETRLRDPARAVKLAKMAVQQKPTNGIYQSTLGECYYRAGDWKAAVETLNQAIKLRQGADSSEEFLLGMAHWRLGDKKLGRECYERAVQRMDKNAPKDADLLRFRAEAAALLGVKENK